MSYRIPPPEALPRSQSSAPTCIACQQPAIGGGTLCGQCMRAVVDERTELDFLQEQWRRRERVWADALSAAIQETKALRAVVEAAYRPKPRLHLMQCLSCHVVGTPRQPEEKVCGNCGSTETTMWFRDAP